MRRKLFILLSLILKTTFIFSNPLFAEDIKTGELISGNNYKLLELKNNFLKIKTTKIPVNALKVENTEMSKTSGMLLGGGIGLIAGGLLGGVLASNTNDDNPIDEGLSIGGGIVVGGLSGLIAGGLTGFLLGK